MPRYSVTASVTGSKFIGYFEADTPQEAERKAWDHGNCYCSLCHQCDEECEDAEVVELFVYFESD